ncbi:MAG: hypothetical protein AAB787_01345 [Patescibacteria group bacterium]
MADVREVSSGAIIEPKCRIILEAVDSEQNRAKIQSEIHSIGWFLFTAERHLVGELRPKPPEVPIDVSNYILPGSTGRSNVLCVNTDDLSSMCCVVSNMQNLTAEEEIQWAGMWILLEYMNKIESPGPWVFCTRRRIMKPPKARLLFWSEGGVLK